jgi:trigger factor
MPDTATAESNRVSISDAGPSRKKISIQIPAETVSAKLRESLDTLSVEAQIPGFRKGRAPRNLVEKRFGPTLRDEAKKQLVAEAYTKAVEDHKLKVVGEPIAEQFERVRVEDGKPLEFDVEVEVMPEFALPSLDGIAVRKPIIEVTDQMVEDEVRKLQINEGRLEPRETPEEGDYLTGRGIMTGPPKEKGGEPEEFYNINGAVVQIPTSDKNGEGMILGIKVPDFSAQFGLPRADETVTIKATGPEHHEMEGVRGADLTITFTVQRIDRIIPASLDDVLARFGMQFADQLRELIRQRLNQRAMIQQQAAMRSQVAQHLIDNTEMELPERLTAQQTARSLQRHRLEMMYRGIEAHVIEERMADLRDASDEQARRELKLMFILAKASEDLSVGVSDAEINGRIAQIAFERNMRPEALRQELIQRNQVGGIFQQIREHKTLDAILTKAAITEIPAEEYNQQVKAQQAAAPAAGKKSSGKKPDKAGRESKADKADEGGRADKPAARGKGKKKAD